MKNKDYMLLYGIAPNISNIGKDTFADYYSKRPIELYTYIPYAQKQGRNLQARANRNSRELDIGRNYIGVLVKRCNGLYVSDISNKVKEWINNKYIKNHEDEIKYILNYCKLNDKSIFAFPPKYNDLSSRLYTSELVRPTVYFIANTDIIVDVAVGENGIQDLYNKYNNKTESIDNTVKNNEKSTNKRANISNTKSLLGIFER